MKSLLVGIGCYLCKVYNYHDSRACGYMLSGIHFWLDGLDGNGVELVKPLWNLCYYFVPVWPYFVIYLNSTYWVVSACNFNLVNSLLIINESSVCAFLLTTLYLNFSLSLPLHIIYLLHLLSTNHKCTQPCYFPPLLKPAQKEKMDWNYSTMSSRLHVTHVCHSYGVMESSAVPFCWESS
jgi:hypothetical protein